MSLNFLSFYEWDTHLWKYPVQKLLQEKTGVQCQEVGHLGPLLISFLVHLVCQTGFKVWCGQWDAQFSQLLTWHESWTPCSITVELFLFVIILHRILGILEWQQNWLWLNLALSSRKPTFFSSQQQSQFESSPTEQRRDCLLVTIHTPPDFLLPFAWVLDFTYWVTTAVLLQSPFMQHEIEEGLSESVAREYWTLKISLG